MKMLRKISKSVLALIIAVVVITSSKANVQAATNSIQLGSAPFVNERYIAGVGFYHKQTTDGRELYCIDMKKNTAKNITANLVKNSTKVDGGVLYILKNGYPNKSITGNNDKDYYITQTAVWWYLDETTGSSNLGERFKVSGAETENGKGMRAIIKNLVNEAIKHKNDSNSGIETKFTLSPSSPQMKLEGKEYVSQEIKAITNNVSEYKVTLTSAPTGTKIVKNGSVFTYNGEFTVKSNETIKVKVPATSLKEVKSTIKLTAAAVGETSYRVYEYQPTDSSMQNVALLEKTQDKIVTDLILTIDSPKVTVTKVDSNTGKAIAGAKLVLKDSTGKEITRWTSTVNAHVIRNLPNGDYTVEELEAPKGYTLNKNITKFTISDTNKNINITIKNAPKKVVVNITKVDAQSNEPIANAVLVVRDKNGKEVARFTTTTNSYTLLDLENGTYTVEEESAPIGYIKSTEKVTFTIDDEHQSYQVYFKNTKETIVPNTASKSSVLLSILGIAIIGTGITFVYKNAQEKLK